MPLRLYNTRTRAVEPFAPLDGRRVRMYVCGLTPSAEAHLGHARSFLFFDVLRRYLKHSGFAVHYVQNVTDIDDRSINRARETGESWRDIVEGYYASFKTSMKRFGVAEPDDEPYATKFIPQILAMIGELVAIDAAYATEDGVYFSVSSFKRYGALSGRNVDELLIGARIAVDEHKHDPLDFALWKFAKPDEPSWPSTWGDGRPGWHIECSAMARELLGEPFDIHGGGYDLIFPHHENEIAQTESLKTDTPMANVWVHGGLLMFDGKKMSKSLGNFEPLSAMLDRHDPNAIRLLFMQTGYRKPMNFTEDSIGAAKSGIEKLRKAYASIAEIASDDTQFVAPYRERVFAALDDDMNTAGALGALFELAGDTKALQSGGRAARALFMDVLMIFGIETALAERVPVATTTTVDSAIIERLRASVGDVVHVNGDAPEALIDAIIVARATARKNKDFALGDRLRDALAAENIVLKDSKDGTTWQIDAA